MPALSRHFFLRMWLKLHVFWNVEKNNSDGMAGEGNKNTTAIDHVLYYYQ
jgi:hypothetical protein